MPGRFFLGVGTGENLNEHVLGAKWPSPEERLEMLEEAVGLMRQLWKGDYQTHRGKHYTVENLRIFDLPEKPVEVAVAAMQPQAAQLAGENGEYDKAGYTHVCVHQIGSDQKGFLEFAKRELVPKL